MNGDVLLDTNILIALFANEAAVVDQLKQAEQVYVSSVALGELYYGACKSGRAKENIARLDEFAASNVVLGCDAGVARGYGEVKEKLRQKGQPIPENDIWIAASALHYNLTLVTRDAHFQDVEGLKVEAW